MRKIKITALLLAVLMIVTAFAGCASKSTVTNLDNKVNDLDASIEEQKAALSGIESTLATISKALENQGSSDNLEEVLKDVQEKNAADLEAAIKDLQATIDGYHKDDDKEPETQAPVETDKDLETAINQFSAKLEALVGEVEDDKANYTVATLAAIRELAGEAETSIENAKDKAAAEAAYNAFADKLADKTYMSVNGKLYAYVVELKGNITDESAELVDEAVDALDAAQKFYKDYYNDLYEDVLTQPEIDAKVAEAVSVNLKNYVISAEEKINLIKAIEDLSDAQYVTLPQLKADAVDLVSEIAKIDATYDFKAVSAIKVEYDIWAKNAKKLSEVNLKYVTNSELLEKAYKSSLNNTVAATVLDGATLDSLLWASNDAKKKANYGKSLDVFYDYIELLATNEQVVFVFDTKKELADGDKQVSELTSKIYDRIDAWVADWAKEYELDELAVEAIINAWAGDDYFYAKYNADKALVKAFEAESKVLSEGVFKNIKALNDKRLGADAMDVLNSYKKNAADISAWRDELVKAYKAEIKEIDNVALVRNVATETDYVNVLTANFHAMVAEAELGEYNNATGAYVSYTGGFLDSKKLNDDSADNAYYHKLYNFKKVLNGTTYEMGEMEKFLRVTYPKIEKQAERINKQIENYPTTNADSIQAFVTGIGGYLKYDNSTGVEKLVARDATEIKGALNRVPTNIAEFVYDYKTNAKYDLSSMINLAAYEEKVAKIEEGVKAADDALAELDAAYGEYLAGDGVVTLSDAAEITELVGLLKAFDRVGRKDMKVAVEIGTKDGVMQYKLVELLDRCQNLDAATIDTAEVSATSVDTAANPIKMAELRVGLLQKEANLVESAYKMMDKIYNFHKSNSFSFDNSSSNGVAKSAFNGGRDHLASSGVVAVTCGDAMKEAGTDAKGRKYEAGQSLWTIEYVTINDTDKKPLFKTATVEGYFYSNYTDASAAKNGLKDAYYNETVTVGGSSTTKQVDVQAFLNSKAPVETFGGKVAAPASIGAYVTQLFTDVPGYVMAPANDIVAMTTNFGDGTTRVLNYALPVLAMNLESRFLINNYGEEAEAITKAKATWDPALGGYGLTYIKALTYASIVAAEGGALPTDAKKVINDSKITTLDGLRLAVKNVLADIATPKTATIKFGGAAYADMSDIFDLNVKWAANYYKDVLKLDTNDFVVDALVIYETCNHADLIKDNCGDVICPVCATILHGTKAHPKPAITCGDYICEACHEVIPGDGSHSKPASVTTACGSYTCEKCGEIVKDYATHTMPTGATACEGYKCDVCAEQVAPVHNVGVTVKSFMKDTATGEYGALKYAYQCAGCAGVTGEKTLDVADVTFVDADTIEFVVVIDAVNYGTFTFDFDVAADTWVPATVAP